MKLIDGIAVRQNGWLSKNTPHYDLTLSIGYSDAVGCDVGKLNSTNRREMDKSLKHYEVFDLQVPGILAHLNKYFNIFDKFVECVCVCVFFPMEFQCYNRKKKFDEAKMSKSRKKKE